MHKVKVFIPAIIWRQEWAPDGAFYPGGTPHNDLYGEAPRGSGTFFYSLGIQKSRDFTS